MNEGDLEDIFYWPDGDWTFREHYETGTTKSDDYVIYKVESGEWLKLMSTLV